MNFTSGKTVPVIGKSEMTSFITFRVVKDTVIRHSVDYPPLSGWVFDSDAGGLYVHWLPALLAPTSTQTRELAYSSLARAIQLF